AGKTLSARKWHAAFSPEGYLDIGKTLDRIHRGIASSKDISMEFTHQLEEKFGNFYSVVMIPRVHSRKEMR
ncbi:hypothetical protein TSUD_93750, partial [Trifolium subterraneum]